MYGFTVNHIFYRRKKRNFRFFFNSLLQYRAQDITLSVFFDMVSTKLTVESINNVMRSHVYSRK